MGTVKSSPEAWFSFSCSSVSLCGKLLKVIKHPEVVKCTINEVLINTPQEKKKTPLTPPPPPPPPGSIKLRSFIFCYFGEEKLSQAWSESAAQAGLVRSEDDGVGRGKTLVPFDPEWQRHLSWEEESMWRIKRVQKTGRSPGGQSLCWARHSGPPWLPCIPLGEPTV